MASQSTTDLPKPPDQSTKPIIIPWKCLADSNSPSIAPKSNNQKSIKAPRTFAQAWQTCVIHHTASYPNLPLKGDKFSIEISDEEYELGLDPCKNNLHARVIWPKGSTPLIIVALREKLKPLWKNLSPWGVTSIEKGFYEFVFSSIEEARRVRSVGSWLLNPGLLKLFSWSKDFKPKLQQNNYVQV